MPLHFRALWQALVALQNDIQHPIMADTFLFYTSDKKNITAPLGLKESSLFLETLYNDFSGDLSEPIPLETISSATLKAIIERHNIRGRGDYAQYETQLAKWEKDNQLIDRQRLFDLIVAANFLDLELILQWSCWKAATMMNENALGSLSQLPDEIQLIVAESLKPFVLQQAVGAGTVPVPTSSALLKRAQHAYVWAKALNFDKTDFSHIAHVFKDYGNAILVGQDISRIYHDFPQKAAEKRQDIHLLLTWISTVYNKDKLKFGPAVDRQNGKVNKIIHFNNSGVVLTIREPNTEGNIELEPEEMERFVDKYDLQTFMLYFRGDCSVHGVDLARHRHSTALRETRYSFLIQADLVVRNPMHLRGLLGLTVKPSEGGRAWHLCGRGD